MRKIDGIKVTKGTVVRTILMVFVLINLVLTATGHEVINVDESSLTKFIECGVNVVTLILCFWKNNSFTDAAKTADFYLQKIRAFDTDEADDLLGEEEV